MGIQSSTCTKIDNKTNNLIFRPPPVLLKNFSAIRDNIWLITSRNGKKICTVWFKSRITTKKYLVWCHGNATDISQMYEYLNYLRILLHINVIGIDYQGYGISEGKPSEENCYEDLETVVEYMKQIGINRENILLCGRSLGTGVVINYAAKYEWTSPIILISPYKTISKVAVDSRMIDVTTHTSRFVSGKHIDKFRSEAKMKDVSCPAKIIHGTKDKIIDISHGKVIYALLPNKQLNPSWIRGGDHNNLLNEIDIDDYKEVIAMLG